MDTDGESKNEFSSHDFDAAGYVHLCSNGRINTSQLLEHFDSISELSRSTSQDLQQNVFKNYPKFIDASKEIAKLDSQMQRLYDGMLEDERLNSSVKTLLLTGKAPGVDPKFDQKSRLQQVQGLDWSNPLVGGECLHQGRFACLDPETRASIGYGHGFLLINSLVFANYNHFGRSNRKNAAESLSLDSIEPLTGLTVKDRPDSKDCKNSIAVEGTTGARLLMFGSAREKGAWLAALRRAVAYFHGHEGDNDEGTIEEDGGDDWLHDVPEGLDVYIAQRDFENSVRLATQAQTALASAHFSSSNASLKSNIEEKVGILTDTLCSELQRQGIRLNAIRATVKYLLQLGETDRAHQMYLKNRSDSVKNNSRKLKMEGSTELYVLKLSNTFFSTLRSTCVEFNDLFENSTKSAFIVWAINELELFATSFTQQVLQPITKFPTVAKCIQEVMAQCRKLTQYGLDLEFVLWGLIENKACEQIEDAGRQLRINTATDLEIESWQPQKFSGNHVKKEFISKLEIAGFNQVNNYIVDKSCSLFEVTSNLVCKMMEFTNCIILLLKQEALIDLLLKSIFEVMDMFVRWLIKHNNRRPIFVKNFDVSVWIVENSTKKLEAVGFLDHNLDELKSSLTVMWQKGASADVSFA